jgi:hypothetical protein
MWFRHKRFKEICFHFRVKTLLNSQHLREFSHYFMLNIFNIYLCLAPILVAARSSVCLRPLACWNFGFESRRGHECLSFVIVVLSDRGGGGLGDGSITRPEEFYDFYVSECDLETSIRRSTNLTLGCCAMQKDYTFHYYLLDDRLFSC